MKLRAAIALALLTSVTGNDAMAQQQKEDGNHWLPICQSLVKRRPLPQYEFDAFVCLGMAQGILFASTLLPPYAVSCPPPGVTSGQAVSVITAFMERNPSQLHQDFRYLAIAALHHAWPCPANSTK